MSELETVTINAQRPDTPLHKAFELEAGREVAAGRADTFQIIVEDDGDRAYLVMGAGDLGMFVDHTADELEALAQACLRGAAWLRGRA
jgi:hypothetical protein